MKVFLLKDVERIGFAGESVKVKDGFAKNFLLPRKLGVEITRKNEEFYKGKIKKVEHRKEAIATKSSMMAEKIKATKIVLKEKTHDDGKLYGSVSQQEVVEALAKKGIAISKSQVEFEKNIKEKGTFEVTIKLSSKLKPKLTLEVKSL